MRILTFIFSLLLCQTAFAVQTQSTGSKEFANSKAQAAQQAKKRFKGRVLKVETRQTTYRVKLLQKSGRVVSVEIRRSVNTTQAQKKQSGR